jgi:hypothetical protein
MPRRGESLRQEGSFPLRLGFDYGLVNTRPLTLMRPGEWSKLRNVLFSPGDVAAHKTGLPSLILDAQTTQTLHSIAHLPLETGIDLHAFLLVTKLNDDLKAVIGKVRGADVDAAEVDPETVAGSIAVVENALVVRPSIVRLGNEFFWVCGAGHVDPKPAVFGGWGTLSVMWRANDAGSVTGHVWGMTPTTCPIEVEGIQNIPFNRVDVVAPPNDDRIFAIVQDPALAEDTPKYEQWSPYGSNSWMKQGPRAGDTVVVPGGGGEWQPRLGHFQYNLRAATGWLAHYPLDYTLWLTEYDEDVDVESCFPSDIEILSYDPRMGKKAIDGGTPHTWAWASVPEALDAALDRARPHHVLQRKPANASDTQATTGGGGGNDYAGGIVLRVKIDITNIKDDTTHLRLYMTPRGGAWPVGHQIPNEFLFVAYERDDPDTDTVYEELADTEPWDCTSGNTGSIFFNLPSNVPGIPLTAWDADITAETGVLETPPSTLQTLTTDGVTMYLFILMPHEAYVAGVGPSHPVVRLEAAGELVSVNPRNVPPPRMSTASEFQNSLVSDDLDAPGIVRWCAPGLPHYWPPEYSYDIGDVVTGISRAGRFLFVGSKRGLWTAKILPTLDLDAELLQESFVHTDENRGPAGPHTLTPFTHPTHGAMLAFMDVNGDLWGTNGGHPQLLASQVRVALPVTEGEEEADETDEDRMHVGVLRNVPGQHRLHFYTHTTGRIEDGHLFQMWAYHYHPDHLTPEGRLRVTGPNDLFAHADVLGTGLGDAGVQDIAASASKVWEINGRGEVWEEDVSELLTALWEMETGLVWPVGYGVEHMIENVRVVHGALSGGGATETEPTGTEPMSLSVHRQRGTDRTERILGDLPLDVEGVSVLALHTSQEGFTVDLAGLASGRIDLIEIDIAGSGVARS